jgi:NADH:ubiquinone oxidoreductase subunit K
MNILPFTVVKIKIFPTTPFLRKNIMQMMMSALSLGLNELNLLFVFVSKVADLNYKY